MHIFSIIFATAMLLGYGYTSNINKQMKMLEVGNRIEYNHDDSYENSFEDNEVTTKKQRLFIDMDVKRHPHSTYVHTNGEILELVCDVFSKPAPTIHWFKNGAPVYEYEVESSESMNPNSMARAVSTLLVHHTDDKDVYTCVITAGANVVRYNSLVYGTDGNTEVSERMKLYPLVPRIVYNYDLCAAIEDTTVVLPCKVKGHPKPHIVWKKNRNEIVQQDSRIKVLRSGELVITSLQWSDMTEYTCEATNVFGSTVARTFLYPIKAG